MRGEYDFSKGVRGKFHRPGARLLIPVYLEPEVRAFVAERAASAGARLDDMVNQLLRTLAAGPRRPAGARRTAARKSGQRAKR